LIKNAYAKINILSSFRHETTILPDRIVVRYFYPGNTNYMSVVKNIGTPRFRPKCLSSEWKLRN